MVAYSFKKEFRAPILAGTKRQTIRADRKRHARPGEDLQLYTGMRTRQCKIIGKAVCVDVQPIMIGVEHEWIELRGERWNRTEHAKMLQWLASDDGFDSWQSMRTFWLREHPEVSVFSGFLISWDNLQAPDAPAPTLRDAADAVGRGAV